ncbi:hypothetical protein NDU88_005517 [Pleurodeles waltl]|uniref:Uncharacterized protein n=1 Tax=Pleurodeles waltl TaxID=8319 RepID=A0AAV7UKD2_PLEWA|nr:hypothetical protein NDU88_005517 [Pleurodeles waltl]
MLADWCRSCANRARRSDRGAAAASQSIRLTGLEAVRRSSGGPYSPQPITRRDLRGVWWLPPSPTLDDWKNEVGRLPEESPVPGTT